MDRLRTARRALGMRRHFWPAALGAGVIAGIGFPHSGAAQDASDLRREMTQMRQQYDAALKQIRRDYDARLRRLEARLKEADTKPAAAPAALPGAPLGTAATGAPPPAPPGLVVP